ncbi:hypothetical protein cypCar_00000651 [Cyprinus carpio]|nr:hypothetical protein cypCar_00000651 [Cyprinus carpio]
MVRKERPELEEQKDSLVINIASGKRKLQELEDEVLRKSHILHSSIMFVCVYRLLNETSGSLLDDVQLVNTLQTSKVTATEVPEQLEISELTESQIDTAREAYRPCAQRASILFFVLNDLGYIDPMYQFSLDAYINLFNLSIESSPCSHKLEKRINNLNRHQTYAVYRVFDLFADTPVEDCLSVTSSCSVSTCAKILEAFRMLNTDEYSFFFSRGDCCTKTHLPCECVCQVLADSTMRTPLIFVLSPGVDPMAALVQLAETSGMGQRFFALSLGQGQAPIATRLIKEGVTNGEVISLPLFLPLFISFFIASSAIS